MKFFKLLKKEISELFTKEIIISMIFTVVLLFAMGNLMTGAMQDIIFSDTVNIIDCDNTEFTAEIKKFLEENGYEVNLLPTDKYTGNIAEDMKNYGESEAILIPEGFTETILDEKKPCEITVICSMKSTTSVTAMTSGASVYDAAGGIEFVVEKMLYERNMTLKGKTITISGSGNVAQYAAIKAIHMGAKVITVSNSDGVLYDRDGFTIDKINFLAQLKNKGSRSFREYTETYQSEFLPGEKPWSLKCDIALPCATQNELNEKDAALLIENGCICIAEGANMPCTLQAVRLVQKVGISYAPGKAANAGGVAVSGLEMSQNRIGQCWSEEKVDNKLKTIMHEIHDTCIHYGREESGRINYLKGANIGGYIKVAKAMTAQGIV